jgi:hypothetical protein
MRKLCLSTAVALATVPFVGASAWAGTCATFSSSTTAAITGTYNASYSCTVDGGAIDRKSVV